jgi:hypothetical protein
VSGGCLVRCVEVRSRRHVGLRQANIWYVRAVARWRRCHQRQTESLVNSPRLPRHGPGGSSPPTHPDLLPRHPNCGWQGGATTVTLRDLVLSSLLDDVRQAHIHHTTPPPFPQVIHLAHLCARRSRGKVLVRAGRITPRLPGCARCPGPWVQ